MQLGRSTKRTPRCRSSRARSPRELNEARIALEAFAERPRTVARCTDSRRTCISRAAHCASPRSTAARCSPKKWSTSHATSTRIPAQGKADADGLDALMRAMEQLPSYVERVASGARDLPLVLLPLLNDLRAVRGGALLSEGTLLLLNLRSDEPARRSRSGRRRRDRRARAAAAAAPPACAARLDPRRARRQQISRT